MKTLKHPNVIRFIGMCYDSNMDLLMALEFANNGSLDKYLKRHNDFSMNLIAIICYQIAQGMEYLSKILVHRDLAARNILLSSENSAKIGDFGLSRLMSNSQYYQASTKERLPLRWYSPEALEKGKTIKVINKSCFFCIIIH